MTLILMIIIIKIFSGIFLCTLLGTILYLFWKAVGRLIEHKGYIDINYLIWKMVLLMFAIPITLIYANGFEKSTYVFEVTGPIKWVIGILMIIWLVGTIIFTIRFLEKQSNKEGYFKCRSMWRWNSKYGKKHIKKVRGS